MILIRKNKEFTIKISQSVEDILMLVDDILKSKLYVPTWQAQGWFGLIKHKFNQYKKSNKNFSPFPITYPISKLAVMYHNNLAIAWCFKTSNEHRAFNITKTKENKNYWRFTKPAYRHLGIYHQLKKALNNSKTIFEALIDIKSNEKMNIENLKRTNLVAFTHHIRFILGTDKYTLPKISWVKKLTGISNKIFAKQTIAYYEPNIDDPTKSVIQLNYFLQNNIFSACRVLAHELCHEAEFLLDYYPELIKFSTNKIGKFDPQNKHLIDEFDYIYDKQFGMDHGKNWQYYANKINEIYGNNFITANSDKSYVIREALIDNEEGF